MKDSEFMELLNLYLDHEISQADAVRLEAEVQSNAARRRIYQDYCRMQKGCKLLAADFATQPAEVSEKVVSFDSAVTTTQHAGGRRTYIAGLVAAAACVAVVFVVRTRQPGGDLVKTANSPQPVVQVAPSASSNPTHEPRPALVTVTAPRTERAQPMLTASPLLLTSATQQGNDPFDWLKQTNVSPLQQGVSAETLRFDISPNLQPDTSRALGSRARMNTDPQRPVTEMSAFEFQR